MVLDMISRGGIISLLNIGHSGISYFQAHPNLEKCLCRKILKHSPAPPEMRFNILVFLGVVSYFLRDQILGPSANSIWHES